MSEAEALCDRIAIIIDGKKSVKTQFPKSLKNIMLTILRTHFLKCINLIIRRTNKWVSK